MEWHSVDNERLVRGRVWVELDEKGVARIFRHYSEAIMWAGETGGKVAEYPRRDAVTQIRERVFEASGGTCRDCGKPINWSFHLHEENPRGKGGEISIYNSIAICARCHLVFSHGNRRLRFGE